VPDVNEIRLPDPCLAVLVGAAGAGKSTFAARWFRPEEILSSDAYRGLVAGDPTDQAATRPAFAALHRDLRRRLRRGLLAVVDATSVTPAARAALLRVAADTSTPAIAIILDLPVELVLARNAARPGGRAVPEPAVHRQLRLLRPALEPGQLQREGFVAAWTLRSAEAVDTVRVTRARKAPDVRGAAPR
jgi:protein phosphatase